MRLIGRFIFGFWLSFALSIVVLASAVVVCRAAATEDVASPELEELFQANSYPVVLDDGKLSGAGGDFLLAEAEDVQFLCLGEPHNKLVKLIFDFDAVLLMGGASKGSKL